MQNSLMSDDEKPEQPFTRFSAYTFLLVGYGLSVGVGLLLGWHAQDFFNDITIFFRRGVVDVQSNLLAYTSSVLLLPDLLVYPPIAVLIVDSMQSFTSSD